MDLNDLTAAQKAYTTAMNEIRLNPGVDYINRLIKEKCPNTNDISDGYHTFGELYEHRIALFQLACRYIADNDTLYGGSKSVWKSKFHSDGSTFEGWFVMGINYKPGEQVTYHLPISEWGNCWYAFELEKAPEFDGHTSADVLKRLREL